MFRTGVLWQETGCNRKKGQNGFEGMKVQFYLPER